MSDTNISFIGHLTDNARLIDSKTNDKQQLIYMTVAVSLYRYQDEHTNEFKDFTQYYDVQLSFAKGLADDWMKKNKLAKGHKIKVSNVIILQLQPNMYENKAYPNNLFTLEDGANMFKSIRFLHTPHAIKTQAPEQQGQQQQGGFSQQGQQQQSPQQQGGFSQQGQQQTPKVNPQEPKIDFDDDIPF